MSSGYAPLWRRILYKVPFLSKKCPDGNYHWHADPYCFCRLNAHAGDWHGGVYCFWHQHEIPYVSGMGG